MKEVVPGVWRLDKAIGAHGYVVAGEGGCAVIDPGMGPGAKAVVRELKAAATTIGPVTAILLTHYDVDHAGAAAHLQTATRAPVYIGAPDAEYLAGPQRAPTRTRRILNRFMPARVRGDIVPLVGETEVFDNVIAIPTPGHTDGHYIFVRGDALFCGDAVQVGRGGTLKSLPRLLISDLDVAHRSEQLIRNK